MLFFLQQTATVRLDRKRTSEAAEDYCAKAQAERCDSLIRETRALRADEDAVDVAIWQFWLNAAGLIGLAFTVIYARGAWQEAQRSANAAAASIDSLLTIERAYLFGGIGGLEFDDEAERAAFKFGILNAGKTPARMRTVRIGIQPESPLGEYNLPDAPDYTHARRTEYDTIFAAGEATTDVITFQNQPPRAVVYGRIEYEDIFQNPHVSRFCLRYDAENRRTFHHGNAAWNEFD